jgi:hypothetical protein
MGFHMLGFLPKTCFYTTVFSAYVQLSIVYKTIYSTLSAAQKHKNTLWKREVKKATFYTEKHKNNFRSAFLAKNAETNERLPVKSVNFTPKI